MDATAFVETIPPLLRLRFARESLGLSDEDRDAYYLGLVAIHDGPVSWVGLPSWPALAEIAAAVAGAAPGGLWTARVRGVEISNAITRNVFPVEEVVSESRPFTPATSGAGSKSAENLPSDTLGTPSAG